MSIVTNSMEMYVSDAHLDTIKVSMVFAKEWILPVEPITKIMVHVPVAMLAMKSIKTDNVSSVKIHQLSPIAIKSTQKQVYAKNVPLVTTSMLSVNASNKTPIAKHSIVLLNNVKNAILGIN